MSGPLRVYLAGPDVFLAQAKEIGRLKAEACAAAGLVGCFPLDAPLELSGASKAEAGRLIQAACEDMMRSCDVCLANCTPFRGVSMDAGTAYEIGFMRALGKPVFGYSSTTENYDVRAHRARRLGAFPPLSDRPDAEVEDFGRAENLMISVAAEQSGLAMVCVEESGERALAAMAAFHAAVAKLAAWAKRGHPVT